VVRSILRECPGPTGDTPVSGLKVDPEVVSDFVDRGGQQLPVGEVEHRQAVAPE
jgi:hypothetical protein